MVTYEEIEEAQTRGMKMAGTILLITAAFGVFSWSIARVGHPAAAAVDLVLGGLLFRLHFFWKPFVLVRAAIGLTVGTVMIFGGFSGASTHAFALVIGGGQIAYCLSLVLLLFDVTTPARIRTAQALFAVSILMTLASVFVIDSAAAPLM